VLLVGVVAGGSLASGADWLQFRGNDTTGVAAEAKLPLTWGKKADGDKDGLGENIAWRAALPGRGVSGPIVVDGKVIVTASSGFKHDRLHVLAFDVVSGKLAWERQFWATGRTLCHPTSSVAAPTPASDGKSIFAFYSSNDLVCLDLDGNLKWFRGLGYDFPTAANDVGMAASPVVVGETVVVQVENKGDSFAAGLDTATGEDRWRVDRDHAMNWTSPGVLRGKTSKDDLVLLQSPSHLSAHRPRTGEVAWTYAAGCSIIPSVLGTEGVVYLPSNGLTALRPGAQPGSQVEVLWSEAKMAPSSSSPVFYDGRMYVINGASVLTCAEAADGKVLWRLRLSGKFWATPTVAGGLVYCVNDQGLSQVVKPGEQGELVAENDLGEPILGSPALADGAIYFRSDAHLWKIATP
jgi:outer membrane protein assembly factor BamB